MTNQEIIEAIKGITVLELNELVKAVRKNLVLALQLQ